jgi:hypothetical protein
MNSTRAGAGDQDNTPFEIRDPNLADATAGFESVEPTAEAAEGEFRLSPRPDKEVPQEPLATRMRTTSGVRWRRRDRKEG